ncbi:MAG: hypothetical protein M3495_01110 [Pseudomonadota bacterium]|nr:hypothetical protein [Pseudomonadota bacterium]
MIAQDPSVRRGKRIVTGEVAIPREDLREGPWGHRVQVVDYDASLDRYRKPKPITDRDDPFKDTDPDRLIADPEFHAWNCYAIVMSTLARFEFALGRRVAWSFGGHQIKVAPHAFADANAFYSRQDESILFGYFQGRKETVFTCLSHDVISHETTHALLDGLRKRYMDPSSPDQAAFHEGFADVVALLSVFAMPGVVERIVDLGETGKKETTDPPRRIAVSRLTENRLFRGVLRLGEQMGEEIQGVRGAALRSSGEIKPSPQWYHEDPKFEESHRRGEILVAAILHAFVGAWRHRLVGMGAETESLDGGKTLDRERVVEEGAALAGTLLTTAIRALDYAPTVDLKFGDYLSAVLTGDREVRPDDKKYDLRRRLHEAFASYGIRPSASTADGGAWPHAPQSLRYGGVHLASLQRDPDEVFRFLWDNRKDLGLDEGAYTEVLSVRPCTRVDPDDGFTLHETVAQYVQIRRLRADELRHVDVRPPDGMPTDTEVTLYGGAALVFDEFGHLKYHVGKSVGGDHQSEQLLRRWTSGDFERTAAGSGGLPHYTCAAPPARPRGRRSGSHGDEDSAEAQPAGISGWLRRLLPSRIPLRRR